MSVAVREASSGPKVTRGHSCLLCQQRKVRCDGQRPCSACIRSKSDRTAKATSTTASRRANINKKRNEDILSRLNRAEELLRRHGLNLGNDSASTVPVQSGSPHVTYSTSDHDDGSFVVEGCQSRYVENAMWDGLSKELPNNPPSSLEKWPDVDSASAPATEMLVLSQPSESLTLKHPDPVRIFWLWQTCLENVNSLVKILHVPTMQPLVFEASADSSTVSPDMEALLFAIYLSALVSASEYDCQRVMGEPASVLVERHTVLAQQALVNARFMRSSKKTTLQAFVLFLLSMRQRIDAQSLWMLTGLAIRSGQRIGLHREKALQGFSILEAEMRRRVWWQIVTLDSHTAKLCGVASHVGPNFSWDTKRPLNINDSDLHNDMSGPPKEHVGATEMIFCSTKYEVGAFTMMHTNRFRKTLDVAAADAEIDALKKSLEQGPLKSCDRSIPIHFLASILGQGAVCQLRLAAHLPQQYGSRRTHLPQDERNLIFSLCLELLELGNSRKVENIKKYFWHNNAFFPFEALIFVLGELAFHNALSEAFVKTAWYQIDKAYELQPQLLQNGNNAMYKALGALTMKAWEKTAIKADLGTSTPRFVRLLSPALLDEVNHQLARQINVQDTSSAHPSASVVALTDPGHTEQMLDTNLLADCSFDDLFPGQYWPDGNGTGDVSSFEWFHSGHADQPYAMSWDLGQS